MKSTLALTLIIAAVSFSAIPAMADPIEVYNEFDSWSGGTWYATQVALRYVPALSYNLGRVEFFTGGTKTGVTIALRPDATDYPSTTILASGTYDSSGSGSWLGATFTSSYPVVAGNTYWITWYNTDGLLAPYSTGILRMVRWNDNEDINNYDNPYNGLGFKTKFYGDQVAPVIPEPSALLLLGAGLGALGLGARRRKR